MKFSGFGGQTIIFGFVSVEDYSVIWKILFFTFWTLAEFYVKFMLFFFRHTDCFFYVNGVVIMFIAIFLVFVIADSLLQLGTSSLYC
jgi:hypothetical protein